MAGVPSRAVAAMTARERERFALANSASRRLAEQARQTWLDGVPMHWMLDWGTPFPLFVREASGNRFVDVDGHVYVDFCLGDTAAMFGHAPAPVAEAVAARAGRGLSLMLPTEDAVAVGAALAERFGLPLWQTAVTASDANRFVLRWARGLTGRDRIVVFNGCYHGAVDETLACLRDGRCAPRPGLIGQAVDPARTTRVVEFNDVEGLEAALRPGDIAAVIAEPVLTNCGIVLPEPGFHKALRTLTRAHGTLLVIDETHTISAGPGGCTRAFDLEPDFLTLGKAAAGGLPAAVYGFTAEVAARMASLNRRREPGVSGLGTTLSGNALALAAMRATLERVMTPQAYAHMLALAERLAAGLEDVIRTRGLPWSVVRLGARAELVFAAPPPRDGGAMARCLRPDLDRVLHLYLLNRGVAVTPFHNMMLVCPETGAADVDRLVALIGDWIGALID
ncbi:MAG: aspartate aminotransferase family protein [Rhodospirillaceae bacterium]|nr:aspartate aminotransferase family protein [Rhodospirillaceae bacterium]